MQRLVPAGTAAAFMGWAAKHDEQQRRQQTQAADPHGDVDEDASSIKGVGSMELAACAYMACSVVRAAAADAYQRHERSMLAGDIIPHLHSNFKCREFGDSDE